LSESSNTWRTYISVAAGFTLLTAALTYPQIFVLPTHVGVHYDALFSIWRLGWIAHQLPRDPLHLFDANIFHPERNTLAYSDAILLQGVLGAPLIWAGLDPVTVHNLLVLLSFVTAAVATYAWLSTRGLAAGPAALGAAIFGFQQYRIAHLPQLELLWTCWIPLAFLTLERIFERPGLRNAVLLGLVVGLQFWSCLYYGVFLVTALAVLAVVFLLKRHPRRWPALIRPGICAVAITVVLCLPYAAPYLDTRDLGAQRSREAANWSAVPANYVSTTAESLLFRQQPSNMSPFEGVLFPGFLTIGLAMVGAARSRDLRTLAYVGLAVIAFDLSLGVNGLLHDPLQRAVPIFASLRVPARWFVIVSAALTVLAAMGAASLAGLLRGRARQMAVASLLAVTLLEASAVPVPLTEVPERPRRVYRWLRDQPPGPIVEWPLPRANSLGLTRVPDYMYYATEHWQPLAVGYSGLYPRSYIRLVEAMVTFPSRRSLSYLQDRGVRYLILHSNPDPVRYVDVAMELGDRHEVELLYVDRTLKEEIAVYAVHPRHVANPSP
jgi:hypothetical protein